VVAGGAGDEEERTQDHGRVTTAYSVMGIVRCAQCDEYVANLAGHSAVESLPCFSRMRLPLPRRLYLLSFALLPSLLLRLPQRLLFRDLAGLRGSLARNALC
jgi:hypothetical protein